MPRHAEQTVETRRLTTMYLVFHPEAGLITTEAYEENAIARGLELIQVHGGKAFVIEAAKIQRIDPDGKLTRLYKVERDRLDIKQGML